ncbi:MAG: ATP-binding protein [Desulfobacterales bacterium]|nr:ATP-binding protein [Desulfobacterales bacterium]
MFPVTAILGARQCGKTTLAKTLAADHYFDLENPRDLARLETPQLTLEKLAGLIIIDEIQRVPDLFPLLRYLVDTLPQQKYVILGSASRDLIRQSSETLAGRIGYYHLGGFSSHDIDDPDRLWLRGGFPRAFLALDDGDAFTWLEHYVATFMERDIPQLGINIPARTLRRFWAMLGHYHGQILNYSELGKSFGISDMTVRKYVDILTGTFMVRTLPAWYANVSKRLVKRPKIYLRDSGIFHYFMTIFTHDQLHSHPKLGASWEGFALEIVCRAVGKPDEDFYFWRTHAGAELDLFWQHHGRNWGVEFKYADAPRRTRSMTSVLQDLELEHLWIVYPGQEKYILDDRITVLPFSDIKENWQYP